MKTRSTGTTATAKSADRHFPPGVIHPYLAHAYGGADYASKQLAHRRAAALGGDGDAAMALALATDNLLVRERYLSLARRAGHPQAELYLSDMTGHHGRLPQPHAARISKLVERVYRESDISWDMLATLEVAALDGNQLAQVTLANAYYSGGAGGVSIDESFLWAMIASAGPGDHLAEEAREFMLLSRDMFCDCCDGIDAEAKLKLVSGIYEVGWSLPKLPNKRRG